MDESLAKRTRHKAWRSQMLCKYAHQIQYPFPQLNRHTLSGWLVVPFISHFFRLKKNVFKSSRLSLPPYSSSISSTAKHSTALDAENRFMISHSYILSNSDEELGYPSTAAEHNSSNSASGMISEYKL